MLQVYNGVDTDRFKPVARSHHRLRRAARFSRSLNTGSSARLAACKRVKDQPTLAKRLHPRLGDQLQPSVPHLRLAMVGDGRNAQRVPATPRWSGNERSCVVTWRAQR